MHVQSQHKSQNMLAERTIKSAKPSEKDVFLADGNGLYVRVAKSGSKTFVYKDQRGGKTSWRTLGRYPELSLLEARQKAIEIKQGQPQLSQLTVRQVADAFYKHLEKEYRSPEQVVRRLEADILPKIGKKPIDRIERAEVTGLLQKIVDRGSNVAANRTLADVKNLFDYAVQKGWLKASVVEGVQRRSVGGKETSRDVNLSLDEIENFITLLLDQKHLTDPGTRWALYFCLVTGCRASEALYCLKHKTLELPVGLVKFRSHRIPGTPHVKAVLKQATTPPKDHRVLSHALRRLNQRFTPHDLRRTFTSRLSDLGVMPHVIEKLLNHKMEGVMAVYNRAEFWPERVAAQVLWDKQLRKLRKKLPGSVTAQPGEAPQGEVANGDAP